MSGSASVNIDRSNIKIAAHRGGNSGAPENSLSGIQNALDIGVTVIEIDVQMTKDGVVVLNHDVDLERVAGNEAQVSELSYNELRQLNIGLDVDGIHVFEEIPTLEAALAVVKDRATLIIDIKFDTYSRSLARGIVAVLEETNMVNQVVVQSFKYEVLEDIRELNSEIIIGQLLRSLAVDTEALDVDFYAVKHNIVTDKFIEAAHKEGHEVWVWTVNDNAHLVDVLNYNIDGIITDYPERVQKLINWLI